MKKVQVTSRGIPSQPRSQYRTGGSTTIMSGGGGTPIDLSAYMLLSRWLENFEERTDANGNPYLYAKKSIVTVGGLTQYATNDVVVPSIAEGIPFDNKTIWYNPTTKVVEVIGGSGDLDATKLWQLLQADTAEQINKSHLTTALQGYATTADVDDRIDDLINGAPAAFDTLKEIADVLQGNVDSIGDIFEVLETKWTQDDAKIANWDTAFSWGDHKKAGYAHLAGEEIFTGLKHFTAGLSVGAGKHKLYEKDGVVYFDGDLAVTGGITQYATDGVSVSTIMDGVVADEVTITKGTDNVLRIKNAGSGSSFDKAAMWAALAANTTEPIHKSHLTTALQGYATEDWVTGKNYAVKSTTLAGYGITDGVNKVSVTGTGNAVTSASISGHTLTLTKGATFSTSDHNHDSRYVNVSGDTMTGDFYIQKSGRTDKLFLFQSVNENECGIILVDKEGTSHTLRLTTENLTWKDKNIWHQGNDGGLFTVLTSTSATNLSIKVGATTKSITDLYANTAAKLETARTIWGQSFDGTKNISGALTSVTDITGTGTFTGANIKATSSVYVNGIRLYKSADNTLKIEGNLLVTGGITQYSTEESGGGSGGGGLDVDLLWEILGGSGTQQINKSHLTNALKGYLTSVSLSTISDLHSSWGALLKAAPSGYVTRWPSISEVTNKQSLVVKLNSGTTEGTNMFTYNATAAKSINITAGSVGAYTKSEADDKYLLKTSYTAADILAKLKTVDGTGSGLDADLLDSWHKYDFHRTYNDTKTYGCQFAMGGTDNSWKKIFSLSVPTTGTYKGCTVKGTIYYATGNHAQAYNITVPFEAVFYLDGDSSSNHQVYLYLPKYFTIDVIQIVKVSDYLYEIQVRQYSSYHNGYIYFQHWSYNCSGTGYNSLQTASSGTTIRNLNTSSSMTEDSAYTAIKLKTPRTLWGRSFDGTANISGNLDGVGFISGSGEVGIKSGGTSPISFRVGGKDATGVCATTNEFRPISAANNLLDLGANGTKWRDLYLGRNAYIDGNIEKVNRITSAFSSGTWINSLKQAVINCNVNGFGAWINGKTKNGRIAIATYPSNGDLLYFGYAAQSKIDAGTDNSYTKQMTWNGATGELYTSGNIKAGADLYINGIHLYKSADGTLKLDGNLLVTGGITQYSTTESGGGSGGGGIDAELLWEILGGTGTQQINKSHLTDALQGYLTSVSIATISDLNSGWDALLKAAPSAYVTRHPTISEVTNKQNLTIQLNGGTTEGTNKFTYNATAAKTINITASSVGAAASSHNHSWANITSGKPTTLAGYGITDAPTKTGSGASGTWAIGISGNAATASKWATARTITLGSYLSGSVSLDGSANVTLNANVIGLTSQGSKTAVTGNTAPASGVRLYQVYNNGYPTNYGNLLSVKGGGAGELLLSWHNSNRIYYRSLRDNGDNWLGWSTVAFLTDNVASANKLTVSDTNNINSPNWEDYKATIQNFGSSATGAPPTGDNANAILNIPMTKHGTSGMYGYQLAFCSNREEIYARKWSAGTRGSWYGIPMVVSNRLKKGFSSVECTDWFRSKGSTGWYAEDFGGGIYMKDSTWVRTYNGKNFRSDNVVEAGTWLSAGIAVNVFDPVGNSWNNGQGAYQVAIPNNSSQTPILVAYNGPSNSSSGTNRYFAIEVLNNGTRDVHFCVTGAETVRMKSNWFEVNGNFYASDNVTGRLIYRDIATTGVSAPNFFLDNRPAIKCEQDLAVIANDTVRPILRWGDAVSNVGYNTRYVIGSVRQGYDWGRIFMAVSNNNNGTSEGCSFSVYGSGYAAVNGNFLATGGITQYSDQRAKTIIEQITLSIKDIANSPAIRFKWNGWKQQDDGKTHIGGIAQYVQRILPEAIYDTDGALTMDYAITGYIFAVNTAKHLLSYETKTDKEIKKLKKRIVYLENKLKSYEGKVI